MSDRALLRSGNSKESATQAIVESREIRNESLADTFFHDRNSVANAIEVLKRNPTLPGVGPELTAEIFSILVFNKFEQFAAEHAYDADPRLLAWRVNNPVESIMLDRLVDEILRITGKMAFDVRDVTKTAQSEIDEIGKKNRFERAVDALLGSDTAQKTQAIAASVKLGELTAIQKSELATLTLQVEKAKIIIESAEAIGRANAAKLLAEARVQNLSLLQEIEDRQKESNHACRLELSALEDRAAKATQIIKSAQSVGEEHARSIERDAQKLFYDKLAEADRQIAIKLETSDQKFQEQNVTTRCLRDEAESLRKEIGELRLAKQQLEADPKVASLSHANKELRLIGESSKMERLAMTLVSLSFGGGNDAKHFHEHFLPALINFETKYGVLERRALMGKIALNIGQYIDGLRDSPRMRSLWRRHFHSLASFEDSLQTMNKNMFPQEAKSSSLTKL